MIFSLLATRVVAMYHRADKFLLCAALIVPCLVSILHVDYTLSNLSAKYHNLTSAGGLGRIIQDSAWSVLFPDKQKCGPCPSVCNETLKVIVQNGNKRLVNKTIAPNDSVVLIATHPHPAKAPNSGHR